MTLSQRATSVRRMFGDVAPTYDLLNHTLSLHIDRLWRRRAVRASLRADDRNLLDLCCGTGDLALEFLHRLHPEGRLVASDFTRPMLSLFQGKIARMDPTTRERLTLLEADSMRLPFADGHFDLASVAFGLRNLDDTRAGLAEMARVVHSGGRVVVLEFCPAARPNLFNRLFSFYFRHILPRIGRIVSRHPSAYRYLPESVEGFPPREEVVAMMDEVGLEIVTQRNLSGGIATLFVGEKR